MKGGMRAFCLCLLGAVGLICLSGGPLVTTAVARDGEVVQDTSILPHSIRVQLKWKHQFQFAGYYAALAKGWYREAGLDVELVEAADGMDTVAEVVDGTAQYGVGSSDLLVHRAKGEPVVALAAIFQHSPLILLARRGAGIETFHDLAGKRVALEPGSMSLKAYLEDEGIPPSSLIQVPHPFDPRPLIEGSLDAMSAYENDEPFLLEQAGVRVLRFTPRSAGIDFYGDILFTTEREIAEHPDRVEAFRATTLRGWVYALQHPDEIVTIIRQRYSKRHSRTHLLYEAERSGRLIRADLVEPGYMQEGRWHHIADIYANYGMVPRDMSLDGFLYTSDRPREEEKPLPPWFWPGVVGAVIALLGIALVAWRMISLNRALHREIEERRQTVVSLRESESRYRVLLENAPFPIVITAMDDHTVLFINRRAEQVFAISAADAVGLKSHTYWADTAERDRMLRLLREQGSVRDFEVELLNGRGSSLWAYLSCNPITFMDRPALFVSFADISQRKAMEGQLRRIADVDLVTGVASRHRLLEDLAEDVTRTRKRGGPLSVLMMDLDHFKEVNDRHGHPAGDWALLRFAEICRGNLRTEDRLGRLGGEEFAALLPGMDATTAMLAAERVRRAIEDTPLPYDDRMIRLTVSIGVAQLLPEEDGQELLARADQALYAAKEAGRNRVKRAG